MKLKQLQRNEERTTQMASEIFSDRESIVRELKKPGNVYVYASLGAEFQIRKRDAIEFASHNDCELVVAHGEVRVFFLYKQGTFFDREADK
jgi:hypothetical protein